MSPDDWIEIPNWDRFQHYRNRRPLWIKVYTDLLRKNEYLDLTYAERGLLHGIWLAYADSNGRLRPVDISARISGEVRTNYIRKHLDSLSHAGFIALVASRPLSLDLKEDRRAHASDVPPEVSRARAWIRNGAAAGVPPENLVDVLMDEFKIKDRAVAEDLAAHAQELMP